MKWNELKTVDAVPYFQTKYQPHSSLPAVTSGTCALFEQEFQKCLQTEPSTSKNFDFPLNLTTSDHEPIASELVSMLKKSWNRFHDLKMKDGVPRVHGDVSRIRQMLRSIEHKVQQTVSNSWEDLQRCLQPPVDD